MLSTPGQNNWTKAAGIVAASNLSLRTFTRLSWALVTRNREERHGILPRSQKNIRVLKSKAGKEHAKAREVKKKK